MIKSMTGFGRCEISEGDRKFTVEMKGRESPLSGYEYPYAEETEFLRDGNPDRDQEKNPERKSRHLYQL